MNDLERDTAQRPVAEWMWKHKKLLAFLLLLACAAALAAGLLSSLDRQREMREQLDQQSELIRELERHEKEEKEQLIQESQPVITSEQVTQQITAVQELVTTEYLYTNTDKYENQLEIHGWNIPLTTKSFLLSYDGQIKAGVDLKDVQVSVDEQRRTVTVVMPEGRILSHDIPPEGIRVFNESDNLFNKITIDNYNSFVEEQRSVMEQKAVSLGLLTRAEDEARILVHSILSLMPGMDTYRLTVKQA